MNSLAMVHQSLKGAISDLSGQSSYEELKIVTKVLPTKVTEHLFEKVRELDLNEAVALCSDWQIQNKTRRNEF